MTAVLPLVLPLTAPVVLGGYAPVLSGQGAGVTANALRSPVTGLVMLSPVTGLPMARPSQG